MTTAPARPVGDRRLVIVEIALVCVLVVALTAALMVAIFRPTAVVVAAATSSPDATSSVTADATPTPEPTVTVYADTGPSTAVRITGFTVGPDPVDCSGDLSEPRLLVMHWTSVNGTKASLTVNSFSLAQNLPPSGDDGDLPADDQPLVFSCQPPYQVYKLTVTNGSSSATRSVTLVQKKN